MNRTDNKMPCCRREDCAMPL